MEKKYHIKRKVMTYQSQMNDQLILDMSNQIRKQANKISKIIKKRQSVKEE